MKRPLEVLDVVALLGDNLEVVFEVEFPDEEGLAAGQLIAWRYSPVAA